MTYPMKRQILCCGMAAAAAAPAAKAQSTAPERPNIIIIMCDQLRAELMGRDGYPLETMPRTNALARQGTWFDKAYTPAPASGPARVAMLTGRFPSATHVRSNHNIEDVYYTKDLFDVARESGYKTALVGKNHSHMTAKKADFWCEYGHAGKIGKEGRTPEEAAYDRFLKTLNMNRWLEPSPGGVEVQLPYRMVDDAAQWIESIEGQPFLMWFSIPEPHNPYQTCEPYFSMFPPESLPAPRTTAADRAAKGAEYELLDEMMAVGHPGYAEHLQKLRSIYHGTLRMIDDQVGRLTEELKRTGVYDNTIIVFVSDHGDFAGEYGLMKKGVGLDDALARVPMQWTGPGIRASAEPHAAHVSLTDIMPTVCEIVGAPIPDGVQGRSLWPLLTGKAYPEAEFASVMAQDGYGGMYYTKEDGTDYQQEGAVGKKPGFFDCLNTWTQSGTMRMVRSGDWKLVADMDGNCWLYDLKKYPSEVKNLAGEKKYADIRARLTAKLLQWELATQDPLPMPRHRYRFKRNPHNYLFNHTQSEIR